MKKNPERISNREIELKLALPTDDPQTLVKRLAKTPVLARRKPTQQHLLSVYYDTPELIMRQKSAALRIRRIGSDAQPQWIQTLKTGGRIDSALSERGEWEMAVPAAALALDVLKATPWSDIDPDGTVFPALAPCFTTSFERTRWSVRRRDGSVIEVALDFGHIIAGEKRTPICELELELKAGQPRALFDLAQEMARTIAFLPANISKAERGYALCQDALDRPASAEPPNLTQDLGLPVAAGRVLRETFSQFTRNLNALMTSDDPEIVHQARVGWRRFKCALHLLKPALPASDMPSGPALQSLLGRLGELRDLEVAWGETLPRLSAAYTEGDAQRKDDWQAMTKALMEAARLRRNAVWAALCEPSVGAALLATTLWLEQLSAHDRPTDAEAEAEDSLQHWSRRRIARLHRQLKIARQKTGNPDSQHRVRILAKRMRYGIEALRPLLPGKSAKRWYLQATKLQQSLGARRDVMQACALVDKLAAGPGPADFLRGVAFGQTGRNRGL